MLLWKITGKSSSVVLSVTVTPEILILAESIVSAFATVQSIIWLPDGICDVNAKIPDAVGVVIVELLPPVKDVKVLLVSVWVSFNWTILSLLIDSILVAVEAFPDTSPMNPLVALTSPSTSNL